MVNLKPESELYRNRARTIQIYVVLILVIPAILDLLFEGTKIARFSRIALTLLVAFSIIVNHKIFLKNKLVGQDTIVIMVGLYVLGTVVSLSHGGVLTPLFSTLLIISLTLGFNIDCYKSAIDGVAMSTHILSIASVVAMILKMNPTGFFLSDSEYPVFFKQLGIAGRNIGVFSHPNVLGEVAALSIVFTLASNSKRYLLIAPLFCLAKCGSRHAILGVIAAALFLFLSKFIKKENFKKVGRLEFPWFIRVMISITLVIFIYKLIQSINLLDPAMFTGRASVWQTALALAKFNPLLGLGWDFEQRAISSNLLNTWAVSAHNNFLEITFCTGLVGLFLFMVLYSRTIVSFSRLSDLEKSLLVYIFISGLVEYTIKFTYPSITSYLFIFINIGAGRSLDSKS